MWQGVVSGGETSPLHNSVKNFTHPSILTRAIELSIFLSESWKAWRTRKEEVFSVCSVHSVMLTINMLEVVTLAPTYVLREDVCRGCDRDVVSTEEEEGVVNTDLSESLNHCRRLLCYSCATMVRGRLVDLPAPSIHVNSCLPATGVRKVGSTAFPLNISSPFRNQKRSCVSPETEADKRIF